MALSLSLGPSPRPVKAFGPDADVAVVGRKVLPMWAEVMMMASRRGWTICFSFRPNVEMISRFGGEKVATGRHPKARLSKTCGEHEQKVTVSHLFRAWSCGMSSKRTWRPRGTEDLGKSLRK